MADLNHHLERIAIVTSINPSGDLLEDIRAGVRPVEQTDHQQLDRLFARLRDEGSEPRHRY
jgi:hypothetical protein